MLRIRLVGELRLDLDERALGPITGRRARSLLAWLAYHPGLHARARVASVFWPDVLESSSRASLRTTLATLRRDLGEVAARRIVAGRDRVGIEDGPEVWIDVREIGRLAAEGRGEEALALCDDDLLTDLDDDWVLEARQAHRDRVVALLATLGDEAEEVGDLETAVRHARRRLDLDPVSNEAARVTMRRLALMGDSAAAVAAFEAFRSVLRRDLGMAPSVETRALADELRAESRAPATPVPPMPDALARTEHAPLVGRATQLAALREAWRRASAGAAGVVVLVGEAGSGKTRLLTELATEVRDAGATVLAGRCVEDAVVAFAPFTEALRPLAASGSAELPEWVTGELANLLPELDRVAGRAEGEPEGARHRLFEAVAAAIGHAAGRGPVLLVVEDLHWADPATLQMLAHVVRTVGWAPLLVAASTRHEDAESVPGLHAMLGDLGRERRLERVALEGLPSTEVGDLAAAWLGRRPPPSLADAVHRRTGGNPLFVEELVRHLVESHPAEPAESLVTAAGHDVPHGVRSVIDRRLARLGEPAGRAVRMAAVAGEDFALTDVAAACEEGDEVVAERLGEAVRVGLIDESSVPGTYRFAHALVREAVIAGLAPTRRALLHRRMAEVVEALPDDRRERRLAELARHLLDAGPLADPGAAAGVAVRAAHQAVRRLAYEDAVDLLERALGGEIDDQRRAEAVLALGDARQRLGDAPSAERSFDEAAAIARALGDSDLLARAALGRAGLTVSVGPVRDGVRALLEEALAGVGETSALRARLLARLAIELYYAPPPALREGLSEEALTAGRRTGGRALLEALGARHVALWSPDHTEERLAIADELVREARRAGDREAELQGVNWRVADLFELGDRDALNASIADHERLADELRLPAFRWYVPMWRASLALLADRVPEAWRHSEEGARIGRAAHDANAGLLFGAQRLAIRIGDGSLTVAENADIRRQIEGSPARGAWLAGLAIWALAEGDLDAARRELEEGVASLASAALDANWLYAVMGLGAVAARLGDARAAASIHPLLLPYGHRMVTVGRGCFCTGSASLTLGLLAATLGDRPAAVAHLQAAVERDDAFGAVAYAAAARHALAGLVEDPARAAALRREAEAVPGTSLPEGLYQLP